MHITIFGASGKVGRQVVTGLLAQGHEVTAFVHSHSPFDEHTKLQVVRGDVHDATAVRKAVQGSDVTISTLGSWHTKSKDILASAVANIILAMQGQGTKRLMTLTGAGALWEHDQPSLFDKANHMLLSLIAPNILRDGEEHLRQLTDSGLDWTCLRSPIMTHGRRSSYRLIDSLPAPWATIPRTAVVAALIEQITNIDHLKQAPFIRRV